jgi:hypothetical protein
MVFNCIGIRDHRGFKRREMLVTVRDWSAGRDDGCSSVELSMRREVQTKEMGFQKSNMIVE